VDTTVIVAIIGAIEGLGIALIGLLVSSINRKNEQYRSKREEREAKERAAQKEKEQLREEFEAAKLDLTFATANAVDVLLVAAHGDEINGNVESARDSITKAKSECNHILNRQAVKH